MGLELGEIDDEIRLDGLPGDVDESEGLADIDFQRFLKRAAFHLKRGKGLGDAAFLQDPAEGAQRRAVCDQGAGAPLQDVFNDRLDNEGMRQEGLFRGGVGHQVRLDQHPAAGSKALSPQAIQHGEYLGLQRFIPVRGFLNQYEGHGPKSRSLAPKRSGILSSKNCRRHYLNFRMVMARERSRK
ncbi:MAG: hypothetical protein A4E72_01204 [Syntrophus sp. PtaU1.Bin208]|nr:MAG: hypothetical protein A4E72_01204 [Syntrophus sp. PtaU1.Bin208]